MKVFAYVRDRVWKWPDGLLWRLSAPFAIRSRREKFQLFLNKVGADPGRRVLDVGGGAYEARGGNYFESHYPHTEQLVVCVYGTGEELRGFRRQHPSLPVVAADGRALPFGGNSFDVAVSNAVIEHVGLAPQQRAFVEELTRVSRCVFLATPNAWFPVDMHTLIPLAHYLPPRWRFAIYRRLGRGSWASLDRLNLLTARQLRALVPSGTQSELVRLRILGITHSLVMILRTERP